MAFPWGDLELTSNSDLTKQLCREFARPDPGGVIDTVASSGEDEEMEDSSSVAAKNSKKDKFYYLQASVYD